MIFWEGPLYPESMKRAAWHLDTSVQEKAIWMILIHYPIIQNQSVLARPVGSEALGWDRVQIWCSASICQRDEKEQLSPGQQSLDLNSCRRAAIHHFHCQYYSS